MKILFCGVVVVLRLIFSVVTVFFISQISNAEGQSTSLDNTEGVIDQNNYNVLNLNPFYSDAKVTYNAKKGSYLEQSKPKQNVVVFRFFSPKKVETSAYFLNMNVDDSVQEAWIVNCFKDTITDRKSCVAGKYDTVLIKDSKLGLFFSVNKNLDDLNPSAHQYIRVDENKAFQSDRNGFLANDAEKIVSQMKKGNVLRTRFTDRDGQLHEEVILLTDFDIVYDYMNAEYSKIK